MLHQEYEKNNFLWGIAEAPKRTSDRASLFDSGPALVACLNPAVQAIE
jgi:hypothetical protein